ncbi:ATP:cob(I)alamin adenosyltransferase [Priestia aryabhattai]|uniref:cob(I)yrinic acid a,c-diamide adenosyltransferase n=1 Tax=Bacillaceae TaxID=186817 RepID=UPI000BA10858|nr:MULTISPECIES: cob(I)yrinic acid a,c-diamide adenosyltransferase [Bacillaceae]MDT2047238.1 cob(I)yrinic acid a,c-diamide adenosyltransferase [Priestia flexa]OZT14196.1 ATP:cob(I)alamin adenosyltransferase [Priestia aryabhattai]TDB54993.1 cob(I)yrinic acid a,c-diamide adenosyltransferase [Bacillus sp. CBEL-1]USY56648.1 cob(I)yrinic acid a,c-diamide adenosyltransferase [Bacillus sp. 1780r2a1]
MNIYTKTGDKGQTSLIGGRVNKDDIRVEAYGTIDELNSYVGQAIAQLNDSVFNELKEELVTIQHELFDCGSDLAFARDDHPYKVEASMIEVLERKIDEYMKEAPEIERFILPGGTQAAATLHVCRTVTRRAERLVVGVQREFKINEAVLQYLNRLSDYFFAAARIANSRENVKDVEYIRSAKVFKKGKTK